MGGPAKPINKMKKTYLESYFTKKKKIKKEEARSFIWGIFYLAYYLIK